RGAGERAEFGVALAFELRNFGDELVADVELDVDVDLGAGEKFLGPNVNVGRKRAPAPCAHRETNLFELDSVQTRAFSGDPDDCFFEIELPGGKNELSFARPVQDQKSLATGVRAFIENDVVHLHSQIEWHAANGNVPSGYVDH